MILVENMAAGAARGRNALSSELMTTLEAM